MGISRYLAMTAAEIAAFGPPAAQGLAYMACHFSPYGTGLSNRPKSLPPGSMLILNDRTPICGHDAQSILKQLKQLVEELHCGSVLLDFQRPGFRETARLSRTLVEALPCPVGVSDLYASELSCPIFLPPAPLDQPLCEYLSPWKDREIWLDIAPDSVCITVTKDGSTLSPAPFTPIPENAFPEESLHCRYRTSVSENEIKFFLWRDLPQLEALSEEAQTLGIAKCIGLYQQFYTKNDCLS